MARHEYPFYYKLSTPEERILKEMETFVEMTDLTRSNIGFDRSGTLQGQSEGKEVRTTVDIPLEELFLPYGLPKGVYSYEEVG
jgi:hypothetical protein